MREFESEVLQVIQTDNTLQVVLGETAFFPEGGGQGADTGYLNDCEVVDVQEKAGVIYHTIKGTLHKGEKVLGSIEWSARFDKMQQHTGEHIISGIVSREYGYHNVGFHLGEDICTLDFDEELTWEQVLQLEDKTNAVIYENVEVEVLYPTKEELDEIDYRSKIEIEGQVRLVRIAEYDTCACCAPHVHRTGEIGIVKFVGLKNHRGGCRISILCGNRALQDYRQKAQDVKNIAVRFSKKEHQVLQGVEQVLEEKEQLKQALNETKEKLLQYQVENILREQVQGDVCLFIEGEETPPEEARQMVNLCIEREVKFCAIFTKVAKEQYRYVIGSHVKDTREWAKMLREKFQSTGGGTAEMVQGVVTGTREEIYNFVIKKREGNDGSSI